MTVARIETNHRGDGAETKPSVRNCKYSPPTAQHLLALMSAALLKKQHSIKKHIISRSSEHSSPPNQAGITQIKFRDANLRVKLLRRLVIVTMSVKESCGFRFESRLYDF